MNIIERNLFSLLRNSAFGDDSTLEPMSGWKWNKLAKLSVMHNLWMWVRMAMENHRGDENLNLPSDFSFTTYEQLERQNPLVAYQSKNKFLEKKHRAIIDKERHAIDTSTESLRLLDLIVNNTETMLSSEIQITKIVELGLWLRSNGNNVDFVKIDGWLYTLQIKKMAEIQASMLVSLFGFAVDEIPFLKKNVPVAEQIALNALNSHILKAEWYFKQSDNGFVISNSKQMQRNMRRSLKFLPYSPLLAMSSFWYNFVYSLKEIEE